MVSTFTPNLHLELQATGDNSGTWGSELNTAVFTILDTVLGGGQTLSLSSSNITVTQTQSQNNLIKLTGALIANVSVIFPAIGRSYVVQNNTTGAFTVTLTIGAGASAVSPQGSTRSFVLDGTNVYAESSSDPGDIKMRATRAVPFGWLECNGAAISRSTFAALFGAIGTTFGIGDGSTTFNIPDMRGYFPRGWSDTGSIDPGRAFGSTQAAAFQSHSHGVTDLGHNHTYTEPGPNVTVSGGGLNVNLATNPTANTGTSTTGITIQNAGGTETRPVNVALLFLIKF